MSDQRRALKNRIERLENRMAELQNGVPTSDTPAGESPLSEVLSASVNALNTANKLLDQSYKMDETLKNLPFKYVIPEMEINVKMTFSHTKGKGLLVSLFKKGNESTEMVSNVKLVAKAIPVDNNSTS